MAGTQDFVKYCDDFLGHGDLPSSQSDSDWLIDDTSAAGTPTYSKGGINGEATLQLASTSEIENVCLHHGDDLNFDIDLVQRVSFRVKLAQASLDATTTLVFGMGSARNDNPDSVAEAAFFKLAGSTSVVVESDDGSNNNDDVATGVTLTNAYKKFDIDFTGGKSNVRFYIDGAQVAASTTFDMSNYSGGLQPIVQIQKTANANTNGVIIDYIEIESRRAA